MATTTNTVVINEIPLDPTDPSKTAWGQALSAQYYFVLANGTDAAETFDAADISDATRALMAQHGRGLSVSMGAGDDLIVASGFADVINAGSGTNYIDGGANGGSTPDGGKPRDVLNVFVIDEVAAAALAITELSASGGSATDQAAYTQGYRIKIVNGDEIDYVKGVEQVNLFVGMSQPVYLRTVALAAEVYEIQATDDPAEFHHHAWVQGSGFADSFNAETDVSAATRALMAQHGRGLWVDSGDGDDTIVGSGYGDDIAAGSGTNYVDGGANAGSPPWGGKAQDVLHVRVANQAAADALQVTALADGVTGADAAALAAGYTHKVADGANVNYIKGIERISVQIADGQQITWVKDIALAIVVHESTDPANTYHMAWASGTAGADTIDMSGPTALLTEAARAAMDANKRGVWIDGGAGDDTITGTAYGDNIRNGAGNAKIDGGPNGAPAGEQGRDVFEIVVATTAEMNAVQVVASDNPDYTWMVTYGATGEKDYLKNIEAVAISVAGGPGKWIPLTVSVTETAPGATSGQHFAWAHGTEFGDDFDVAAGVSDATRALMDQHERGVWIDTGAGNDTITGSNYGDDIAAGSGINYVNGGGNAGTPPWGGKAQDVLHVRVADQAAADALQVSVLAAGGSGADAAAYESGYTHKVADGANVSYIRNIERVSVQIANGDQITWVKDIALTVVVHESGQPESSYHAAWVNGTAGSDAIDMSGATPLLTDAGRTAMATHQRGVWVDGGAGNDTITGTAYADNFRNGAGNARIDGGSNDAPQGQQGRDVFEIEVASAADMAAIRVEASDDAGYQWMVIHGATGQKDYLKNIEAVAIIAPGGAGKWIPLALEVNEISATANLAGQVHFAWAHGTDLADTFDAASAISDATQALMDQHDRGVWVETGAGDDTITGSGYGDDIDAGSGTNHVDGGANAGSPPWGGKAQDVLHVRVASQAEADAVHADALSGASTGTDAAAYAGGYTHKVVNGASVSYVKGIERVSIEVVDGSQYTWARDIALAIVVHESAQPATSYHVAWASGTDAADTIDMSGATPLLTDAAHTAMDAYKSGVWIDGGAGNDTITGTAYGDNFRNGAGSAKIDGGANGAPDGEKARDVFEIEAASAADMSAIEVVVSDDPAYEWMVVYGNSSQKDYLKNVEAVVISAPGGAGKWIPLVLEVHEIAADANLEDAHHFAWANGTARGDTFNAATDVSAATLALMQQHGRGMWIETGAGNDTITGTGFGDDIDAGSGTNHVDGGANAGSPPWGGAARDTLRVHVSTTAQADAVQVSALTGTLSGADAAASTAGYTHKVVNGSDVSYIKGIETVSIIVADSNTSATVREILLTVLVREASTSDANLGDYSHLAWVNGTATGDTIDMSGDTPLLTAGIKSAMATHQSGAWIDGGAGNDTITGSAYGDFIRNGAGNAQVDGGANAGGKDIFHISVATSEELAAVQVSASDDPAYQWMVTYGASGGQKDYLKNVEAVTISVTGSGSGKMIPLVLTVDEIAASANLASSMHFAWAQGTSKDDQFSATVDISDATQALMAQHGRGVYVDSGAGNDTITGSAYGDNFVAGAGTNYIDGGAQGGSTPAGGAASDTLDMYVANAAAAAAVSVTTLSATAGSEADRAAFDAGYRFKVANGTVEVNYVKGIERVNVFVWDDKDGDGMRDYAGTDPANEVTFGRQIALTEVALPAANTAPTFAGVPRGVLAIDSGASLLMTSSAALANGKVLGIALHVNTDSGYRVQSMVLTRSTADGSIDTTFGNGAGMVRLTVPYGTSGGPLVQADGKLVIAVGTVSSTSDVRLVRLNEDGSQDMSFGSNGQTMLGTAGSDMSRKLLLQSDGKIVVVAAASGTVENGVTVYRLDANGAVDTSYGSAGKFSSAFLAGNAIAQAAMQADGKVVVVSKTAGSAGVMAAVRVNLDGTLDASFGSGGTVELIPGVAGSAAAVALQGDGKILVGGGVAGAGSDTDMALVRLNANGTLDTSFAQGGKLVTPIGVTSESIAQIVVQADGKILALANVNRDASSSVGAKMVLFRFNADGSADTSFGHQGASTLSLHGTADFSSGLMLVGDKIVVTGYSYNDTNFQFGTSIVARFTADGKLDPSFAATQGTSLGGTMSTNGVAPQSLDPNASIYDAELVARGHYAGASLTVARSGGANAEDVFTGVGNVSFAGGKVSVGGIEIGTATQGAGSLAITFNDKATQGMVNLALHGIGYSNSSSAPPASMSIDWTFSDGNDGTQGTGGARQATGTTIVQIGIMVAENSQNPNSISGRAMTGVPMAEVAFWADVRGTNAGDSFDAATGFSAGVTALMNQYQRGAYFDMGNGNDTVAGTAFSDQFQMSAGVDYIDGRAHQGTHPWEGAGLDELRVVTPNEAAADAVRVTLLAGATDAADQAALAAGYEAKVVNGTAVTYIRNVERVTIFTWTDSDGDGVRDPNEPLVWSRPVDLALKVNEVRVSATDPTKDTGGNSLADSYHFAWAESTLRDDTFNAATDVSAATQALMAQYGRGLYVNTGSGNDTVTGSAYGDNIAPGSGINYVDGGANGNTASGNKAVDVLEIFVADAAAAAAVSVSLLESGSADMRDAAAFSAGYTHKVVNGATVDYVKNIERVVIFRWTDADANEHREWSETHWLRDIQLAMRVDEIQVSATNPAQDWSGNPLESNYHFAWAHGTDSNETFNVATDVSAPTRALMDQYQRGVYVSLGAGNDTIVGSAYADQFEAGTGVNYIDGGANSGSTPDGNPARDSMSMWVGSRAESDALAVQRLAAGTGSAADQAAFASGYVFKVASGTGQVNYVKDVEELHVLIWEDKDGDGVRDYGTSQSDPNNEVTFGRYEQLILNSAPTFAGAPAGVAITDGGIDFGLAGGATTLADGKVLTLSYLAEAPAGMPIYGTMLTRSNPDGSIDTSFGNGGMIRVSVYFPASAPPAVQADGKILIAFDSGPTAAGDVHLIRLNADGSEDASFGANGHAYIAASAGRDFPRKVLVQADGKIVVVSFSGGTDGMLPEYTAFRVNSNGTLDTSYGNAGKLAVTFAANGGTPATAILQPDGKLLMVGSAKLADNLDFAAVRVNTNGTLDASFGDGGKLVLPIGVGTDSASPVAVLSDGKILVAGHSRSSADPASDWDAAIVRLNANGTPDVSFGDGGKVVMAMPEHQQIYGLQVQPDGKFLALVLMTPVGPNTMGREVAVVRFNANGSVDTNFGDEGATTLQLHGITDSAFSLMLVDGKIIVAGSTTNDTQYNTSGFLARLNADGSLDATFGGHVSSLGGTVRTTGTTPVALDKNASVYDAEMATFGHYGGAMLTVQRQGGANAEDKFTGIGDVSFANNGIFVGGVFVGNSDTSGGSLKLWFNGNATQGLVNRVLHGIGYSNSSDTPPSTVTISWSFSDGNTHGGQGQGGELTDTGTTTVQIGTMVTEYVANPQNPAQAVNGWLLTNIQFFANVQGTAGGDSFDANSLSAAVKTLMAQYTRGVRVELGGGNDTVVGSGYSDEIVMGSGIDYVDGRAHDGSHPWHRAGLDELRVYVADEVAADAVRVSQLSGASTGEDLAAFNQGYEAKVVNGAAVTYVKNLELVTIFRWNDTDGDGARDGAEMQYMREIPLALRVNEVSVNATDPTKDGGGQPLADYMHMAWAGGTLRNDTFNAATDVSAATQAVMAQYGRGVFVDTGAGNDTVTGSAYGDNIISGSGINYVDGGANGGSPPGGHKAADVLEIYVTSDAAAAAVSLVMLASGSADTRDAAAFAAGYTHKVTNGENVDYVKNIERIAIFKWTDADNNEHREGNESTWLRDIQLVLRVDEIQVSASDPTRNTDGVPLTDNMHFAWAWGAAGNDTFSAETDISVATQQLMDMYDRGVYAETGAGNDTVVGSAYGDDIDAGDGVNLVDGGANFGVNPYGAAVDTLRVTVATRAESDGLEIAELSASSADAADRAAFADGYLFKVVNGSKATTYLKNVERVHVDIWDDKDGDGQRDYRNQEDPANEVTFGRYATLNTNTAPTFTGAAPGIALQDAGSDFGPIQGTVLPGGKVLTVSYINHSFHGNVYEYMLTRTNTDGSADTSFGDGTGRVVIGKPMNSTAKPVIQADGKILFAGAVRTEAGEHDFHVWRYNADGSLDSSFGNGGVQVIDFNGTDDLPLALALQGDKIVVVGNSYDATTHNSFAATRLNANGTLDTSFANGGKFTSSLSAGSDSAFAVQVQADGKLLLGGRAGGQMAALRLSADGTLDHSFGEGGVVLLPTTVNSGAFSMVLSGDKILLAGESGNARANVAASMVRLLADGTLDASFGNGGTLNAQLSQFDDRFLAIEVQADGKIVAAGYASNRTTTEPLKIAILRFNADGSLDTQFGEHGSTVLQMRGVADQLAGMSLVGGKIVVYGTTVNDTNYNTTGFIARLNSDGSMDTSFGPNQADSLGGTVVANGIQWQALDLNAAVFDAEMAARGHYGGAELVVERKGGVSADDVFSGVGEVSLANGVITVAGKEIGTANVQVGFVQITFNDQATQGLVNRALHGIGYANLSLDPQPSIELEWRFSDQNLPNSSWQGNGAGVVKSTTTVQIAATVHEVLEGDPGLSRDGQPLGEVSHFAYVRGSVLGDHFNAATALSPAVQALMQQYGRGASFDMMRGDDVITGTAFSDEIVVGSGINYIDGGDQLGSYPWGGAGRDELRLFVPSAAAAAAVQTSLLSAASTGADLEAFNQGYDIRIANGTNINYARNLELVSVFVWNNTDGDGQRDPEEVTFSHGINLTPLVHEVHAGGTEPLSNFWHFVWINGWERADVIDAMTGISVQTLDLMSQYKRGASIKSHGGNDILSGTPYADEFSAGSGVNRVDGKDDEGINPDGRQAADVLNVFVSDAAAGNAVAVTLLAAGMSGDDAAAFADGYVYRVQNGDAITYVKNVENLVVYQWTDTNGNGEIEEAVFLRSVPLALDVHERVASASDPTRDSGGNLFSEQLHFAWANGTLRGDSFDATTQLSAEMTALMNQYQRGMHIELGGGNDTVTGTAYGDHITFGSGVDYIDGGAHGGTRPWDGSAALDTLEIYVPTAAAADDVSCTALTGELAGADLAAAQAGYQFKVMYGGAVSYVKNVEEVLIQQWQDKDGDGQRDYAAESDPANEITFVKVIGLPPPATP